MSQVPSMYPQDDAQREFAANIAAAESNAPANPTDQTADKARLSTGDMARIIALPVLCLYLSLVGMGVATVVAVIRLIHYLCTF